MGKVVRASLFGSEPALRFEDNGMVVDSCELLKLDIADPALAQVLIARVPGKVADIDLLHNALQPAPRALERTALVRFTTTSTALAWSAFGIGPTDLAAEDGFVAGNRARTLIPKQTAV